MGYNNEKAGIVPFYFDIETVGNPDAVNLLNPPKARGNLVDPAKIAADLAAKAQKRMDEAALDCDTAQIVCVGMDCPPFGTVAVTVNDYPDERAMIEDFWQNYREWHARFPVSPVVGFNCLGFDLPVLLRRSQLLGVQAPSFNLNKYRHDGIVDLMALLTWDGLVDPKGLSVYCRLFGIDVPDETTGSNIAAMVAAGDWVGVSAHCAADVAKTKALYERVV